MMLYEELHSKVINFYGYSLALLEEPVVMDAVKELVNDRRKLLADTLLTLLGNVNKCLEHKLDAQTEKESKNAD